MADNEYFISASTAHIYVWGWGEAYVLRNRIQREKTREESRFFLIHFLSGDTRGFVICTNNRVVCGVELEYYDVSYGSSDAARVERMGSLDIDIQFN